MKLTRSLAALVTIVVLVALAPAALAAKRPATRDVLVVSNNWAGSRRPGRPAHLRARSTASTSIPDRERSAISRDRRGPDRQGLLRRRPASSSARAATSTSTTASPRPTGRVVYFFPAERSPTSSPSTSGRGRIRWRTKVDGYRADHMAHLGHRPPAARLRLDRERRRRHRRPGRAASSGAFPSGDAPHRERLLAPTGQRIFHASIGLGLHRRRRPVRRTRPEGRGASSRSIDARTIPGARADRHGAASSPRPAVRA